LATNSVSDTRLHAQAGATETAFLAVSVTGRNHMHCRSRGVSDPPLWRAA